MKVVVTVVNTLTGRTQHGVIDEPVVKGLEVQNALKHFGVETHVIDCVIDHVDTKMICGHVLNSNNYFTLICYEVQEKGSLA